MCCFSCEKFDLLINDETTANNRFRLYNNLFFCRVNKQKCRVSPWVNNDTKNDYLASLKNQELDKVKKTITWWICWIFFIFVWLISSGTRSTLLLHYLLFLRLCRSQPSAYHLCMGDFVNSNDHFPNCRPLNIFGNLCSCGTVQHSCSVGSAKLHHDTLKADPKHTNRSLFKRWEIEIRKIVGQQKTRNLLWHSTTDIHQKQWDWERIENIIKT